MKKKKIEGIKVFLIVSTLVVIVREIYVLPWWTFVVPVYGFGAVIGWLKWDVRSFPGGFLSGFSIWLLAGVFFNSIHNGIMLKRIGLIAGAPGVVILLVSALMGGLVTGLALYAGKSLFKPFSLYNLD